ncbi:isocitrate/isopropylmalate dehydrogenase family protein [Candidatus Bathyarchaeota archaeon]|nr:isocitrate/isopropylmalate dehydrogenase family protein [Candidatus Bathyarchaeota archaeon]MBS7629963.1 isocitrate/isopropylmalate dehydrogenase family protein [Candidatus Bathyarchaeota archaeon]
MKKYKIATIPGDGIGPEVMDAALSILRKLENGRDVSFDFIELSAGDETLKKTGSALPSETLRGIKQSDVCLFAAVGETAKDVIIPLRQGLDLYANIRPAKVYPNVPHIGKDVDLVIIRENTEDLYKRVGFQADDWGVSLRIITRQASERIARFAFELAKKEERKRVTCVHKANVLDNDIIFTEACRRVSKEYPSIEYEETIVDACAMKLILKPEHFDVVVTTNMFGDILSDEAAGLVGGLGMAPSGNIGDRYAIFEPVHGSAPDIAGRGIANPIAMVLSVVMMLKWLGELELSRILENAIVDVLKEGRVLTPDLGGKAGTKDVSEAIEEKINRKGF